MTPNFILAAGFQGISRGHGILYVAPGTWYLAPGNTQDNIPPRANLTHTPRTNFRSGFIETGESANTCRAMRLWKHLDEIFPTSPLLLFVSHLFWRNSARKLRVTVPYRITRKISHPVELFSNRLYPKPGGHTHNENGQVRT